MALSTDIYTILRADNNVKNTFATRIYPVIAPEKVTLPCIVYSLNGLTPNENKTNANGWDECSVTVSAVATTFTDAETYGNYIRTALNRYKGTISSDTVKALQITSQDWEYVPDFAYQGSTTGIAVFAVNTQCVIKIAQNISE